MPNSRVTRRLAWIGVPIILLVLLVLFWSWDWLIPIVEARASAAIGRPVTIAHLHVRLGRVVEVIADDVVVANPHDWAAGDPPLAAIRALT
ncbi:MAG: AsmA family protein, partial [Acetobacteraceae bacterium]|nr:AsmA family protein [Acetobacteraceae bacterium]